MTKQAPRVLLLPFLLFGTLPAQAPPSVSFSFHGGWTASGRTNEGNTSSPFSYVSLTVGNYPEIRVYPRRGDTPAQVTDRCRIALENAGFIVVVVNPTEIKVVGRLDGGRLGGGAIGESGRLPAAADSR